MKVADKKAMEMVAMEEKGMKDNWIWKMSERNTDLEAWMKGNGQKVVRIAVGVPATVEKVGVGKCAAEKPKVEKG